MTESEQGLGKKVWNKIKTRNDIICPNQNCGFKGSPKVRSAYNPVIGILLLICGIVPGLIYMAITGVKVYCPKCNMQVDRKSVV